ncbi:hypothetical protein DE4576_03764 [Mycobacterium marinum]|uniref:Uncharacterized protein n=1 Tax=Mycobacterium pseudoshottsii TaxID=265949 RepID=A0A9N7LV35_9MYCO|nr:hypothetical protein VIMS_05328 [Mycobacterium marinum]RFZ64871.1 hypothetical protein DE4576_03764 [Mycobacterium marinum]RFZ72203.1 hypothetical protein DL240490_00185 [Mycobacterium marinum]BDN83557.1 hypothetical protein NJB1907Z4_C37720 [Mycobacterium pseudoshottsii]
MPNKAAIATDTSSAPAASTVVVAPAAAALTASIDEPMRAKSEAAVATTSGATLTNDIKTSVISDEAPR